MIYAIYAIVAIVVLPIAMGMWATRKETPEQQKRHMQITRQN